MNRPKGTPALQGGEEVRKISEALAIEKSSGRPPHWEMVFWWTRKPLISARAVIAGAPP
jgi:putative DNA methylase